MRRATRFAVTICALVGAALIPATALAQGTDPVAGNFSLQAMAHQRTAQFPTLFNVRPWDGTSLGRFSYRSIPCSGNAPVNNISSDLPSYGTRVGDSRAPSSTRLHNLTFRVVRTRRGTEMLGTTSIVVCQLKSGPTPSPDPVSDEVRSRIRVTWRAAFVRNNSESLSFRGTFKLAGGTQRYADITGSGTIGGYLFCFAPEGCGGGGLQDAQVSMQGSYADPTPQL